MPRSTKAEVARRVGEIFPLACDCMTLREIRARLGLDFVSYGQPIQSTRELNVGQPLWLAPSGLQNPRWQRASVVAMDEAFFHVAARQDPRQPGDTPQQGGFAAA